MSDNLMVLSDIVESAAEMDAQMTDLIGVTAKDMHFENGQMHIKHGDKVYSFTPTVKSLELLLAKLELNINGGRKKNAELLHANIMSPETSAFINRFLTSYNNELRMFNVRAQSDDLMAVFDSETEMVTRSQILNPFMFNLMRNGFSETARVVKTELDNKVFLRLLLDDYTGIEHHGVGIELNHSLLGLTQTSINPLVKTTSCNNSLVATTGFRVNTTGGFMVRYSQATRSASALVHESIESIKQLEALYDIENPMRNFFDYMKHEKRMKFTDPQIEVFRAGTRERENTLYGQVNGLTYLAHNFPEMPTLQQYECERLAGQIIVNPNKFVEYGR